MSFLEKLKKIKRKQEFNPGLLGIFTNPFYIARNGLHKAVRSISPSLSGSILDVGCGSKPYKQLFTYTEYVGMDIENPGHDHSKEEIEIYYDGTYFPFQEKKFDNIICNQVLEHVFEPTTLLGEMSRVLKPGGLLLLTVPFVWDEHEQPNDYARYSSFGLKYLLEKNGFEVLRQEKTNNHAGMICQLINAYTYKKVITRNGVINQLLILLLMCPFNILGEILRLLLPKNNDLYLDNIVLARNKRQDV